MNRGITALLLLVFAIAWFGNLGLRKLAHPDEGRYAEIPREMVATGDWVTPRLNDLKYLEKPPLQYWATATAYELFGFSEWTARLWPALTGFLGIIMTWWVGRRLFSPSVGMYAALVLVASPYYVAFAHILTLDMGVAFLLSSAMFTFLLARHPESSEAARNRWMLATWVAMGLAFLSKGLIAFVLPLLTLTIYSALKRDMRVWHGMGWASGLSILGIIGVPWVILVSRANPEFLGFFFIHEHFARFTSSLHSRTGPFWYFIPILALALLPFLPAAYAGLRDAFARSRQRPDCFDPKLFLAVWCAIVFVFFSVSQSKLPAYILPMMPAIALLIGQALTRSEGERMQAWLVPLGLFTAAVYLGLTEGMEAWNAKSSNYHLYESFSHWLETGAGLVIVGAIFSLILFRRWGAMASVASLAISLFVAAQLAVIGFETLSPLHSAYAAAQQIRRSRPDITVFSVRMYDQSLVPYIDRTVTLVDYEGELHLGIQAEPWKVVSSPDPFYSQWNALADAWAIMTPKTFDELVQSGFRGTVAFRDTQRVLVRKRG